MADSQEELLKRLSDAEKKVSDLSDKLRENITVSKMTRDVTDAMSVAYQKVKSEGEKYRGELDKATTAWKAQLKIEKEFKVHIDKLMKENTSKLPTHFKNITAAVTQAKSHFLQFSAVLGGVGFSIDSIVKSGLEYNRALVQMGRTQSVVGDKTEDTAKAMEYVSKATNLSKLQFADFSKTITRNFVGIRPSLMEIARLSKDLAINGIISSEDQKAAAGDLLAVQSKFPALYEKMKKGIELAAKINKDASGGNAGDKERLELIKDTIYQIMQLMGVSSEEKAKAMEKMALMTDAQKKLNEATTAQQQIEKEFNDAKIKMFEAFRPLIVSAMGLMTEFAGIIGNNAKGVVEFTAAGVGIAKVLPVLGTFAKGAREAAVGVGALRAGMMAVGSAHPIGLLLTALIAVGVAGYKVYSYFKNQREEVEKLQHVYESQVQMHKEVAELTGLQRQRYDELMLKEKSSIKNQEDSVEAHVKVLEQIKKEKAEQDSLLLTDDKILQNITTQLEIINKIKNSYEKVISVAEKFGIVNETALAANIKMADKMVEQVKSRTPVLAAQIQKIFGKVGVKIEIEKGSSAEQQAAALQEILDTHKNILKDKEEIEAVQTAINKLQTYEGDVEEAEGKAAEARQRKMLAYQKQMEEFGKKREATLEAQRSSMEKAQFGFGPSIAMMQQQVDLEYKLMGTTQQTLEGFRKQMLVSGKLTPSMLKQVEAAESQEEAVDLVKNKFHLLGGELDFASGYWGHFQDLSKKIFDYQSKIYDLTKEVREGYLDAVREMSSGAGEFEKIVGSQEMGITQLMSNVDKFTKGALNTMGRGGLQSKAMTAQGTGVGKTGEYTMGGPRINVGDEEQTRRNSRIWKWDDAQKKMKKILSGEQTGSRVGGIAGMGENLQNMRPAQEDEDITFRGVRRAILETSGRMHQLLKPLSSGGTFPEGGRITAKNAWVQQALGNSSSKYAKQNQIIEELQANNLKQGVNISDVVDRFNPVKQGGGVAPEEVGAMGETNKDKGWGARVDLTPKPILEKPKELTEIEKLRKQLQDAKDKVDEEIAARNKTHAEYRAGGFLKQDLNKIVPGGVDKIIQDWAIRPYAAVKHGVIKFGQMVNMAKEVSLANEEDVENEKSDLGKSINKFMGGEKYEDAVDVSKKWMSETDKAYERKAADIRVATRERVVQNIQKKINLANKDFGFGGEEIPKALGDTVSAKRTAGGTTNEENIANNKKPQEGAKMFDEEKAKQIAEVAKQKEAEEMMTMQREEAESIARDITAEKARKEAEDKQYLPGAFRMGGPAWAEGKIQGFRGNKATGITTFDKFKGFGRGGGHFTSAAEKRGDEASPEDQAAYTSAQGQAAREAAFGATGTAGEMGGAQASRVLIDVSPEAAKLIRVTAESNDVVVQARNAVASVRE